MSQSKLEQFTSPEYVSSLLQNICNIKSQLSAKEIELFEKLNRTINDTFENVISGILKVRQALMDKLILLMSQGCNEEKASVLKRELEILRRKIISSNFNSDLINQFYSLIDKHNENMKYSSENFQIDMKNLKEKVKEFLSSIKSESAETTARGLENVERWTYEAIKKDINRFLAPKREDLPSCTITELKPFPLKNMLLKAFPIKITNQHFWGILQIHGNTSKSLSILNKKGHKYAHYIVGRASNQNNWALAGGKPLYWRKGNIIIYGHKSAKGEVILSFFRADKGKIAKVMNFRTDLAGDHIENLFDIVDEKGLYVMGIGKELRVHKIGGKQVRTINFDQQIELVKYMKDIKCLAILSGGCIYVKEIEGNLANGRILYKIPIDIETDDLTKAFTNGNVLVMVRSKGITGIEMANGFYHIFEKKQSKRENPKYIVIFPENKLLLIGLEDYDVFMYDFLEEKNMKNKLWKNKKEQSQIEAASDDGSRLLLKTPKTLLECTLEKNL